MADEDIDLDLLDDNITKKNQIEERFNSLNGKVITTAKERDEANAKLQAETTARASAEKERDFYASFSDSISKYPNASGYRDAIKEKVMGGYSVEDATVAVLAREGQLQAPTNFTPPTPPPQSPAGGSSPSFPTGTGAKPIGDMNREEKRQALHDAEKRGDISMG